MSDYNGYTNYQTWNVALWIKNDEGLYHFAKECRDYDSFRDSIREFEGEISLQTPDGVAWNDSGINLDEINEVFEEL